MLADYLSISQSLTELPDEIRHQIDVITKSNSQEQILKLANCKVVEVLKVIEKII
jgi:uncharacterized secreted protein with C-terminal beta-propeller domain